MLISPAAATVGTASTAAAATTHAPTAAATADATANATANATAAAASHGRCAAATAIYPAGVTAAWYSIAAVGKVESFVPHEHTQQCLVLLQATGESHNTSVGTSGNKRVATLEVGSSSH